MSSELRPTVRALAAFALANTRYWLTVASQVRREMRHWQARAQAIEDPAMRELALSKLRSEGFNAEAAAMAATIAPRPAREHAVRAIVALELMFDLLDGLTERPHADPLGEGERLYTTFVGALDPYATPAAAQVVDGYLHELGETVREAISQLPAREAIAPVAALCAARGAQAQIRMHATPLLGQAQLGDWARGEALGGELPWREFLAGSACAVLALHALIAAAGDPRTSAADAQAIEAAYLLTGAMVTLLDGVVDQQSDTAAGILSYAALYEEPRLLAQALANTAREAARHSAQLRNGAHHLMTLAAAAAYWGSAPSARIEPARTLLAQLRGELPPAAVPMLVMRAWRRARTLRPDKRPSTADAQS